MSEQRRAIPQTTAFPRTVIDWLNEWFTDLWDAEQNAKAERKAILDWQSAMATKIGLGLASQAAMNLKLDAILNGQTAMSADIKAILAIAQTTPPAPPDPTKNVTGLDIEFGKPTTH
jgi:hypothetical protein